MKVGDSIRRRRSAAQGRGRKGGTPPRRSRSGRTGGKGEGGRTLVLAALLALIVGGGAGYLFATKVIFPTPERAEGLIVLPDLRGLALAEAEEKVSEIGLTVESVERLRHPTAPEEEVLGQSPLPGQAALPSAQVFLSVSAGAERRPLDDVLGMDVARATALLEAGGFILEVDTIPGEAAKGSVVTQDPPGGGVVTLPLTVRLEVSEGPPMVLLPDLTGREEGDAVAALAALGLEVAEVRTRYLFGTNRGLVVEQIPAGGTELPPGSPVTLIVGRE